MSRQEGTLISDEIYPGVVVASGTYKNFEQISGREFDKKVKRSHLIQDGTIIRKGVLR